MPDERIAKIEQSLKDIEYRLNTHKHSGADLTQKIPQRRYFSLRLVTSATNTAVANVVGGDFSVPFSGYVESIEATVDTAGTTGTTDVDVNINGSSIMTSKLKIDSTEKTTRTAATRPVIKSFAFTAGDIFTFDVDAVSTTAAQGLTVHLTLIEA